MRCPLETCICLICKGNRLDVLGNLSPNLSLCKILQNWAVTASETEYRKAVMIHALQRVFCAWKRISHLQQLPHSIFQNTMFFLNQTANQSIRWLVTYILRWLQHVAKKCRFFLSSDLVASHLLLEESDIDLWKTNNYCTQLHTFVTMSMAHDWRPCTWRVNADLEAWKLLGQVFDMVRSMDVNIFFFPCCLLYFSVLRHLEPAVQLLFVSQLAWQLAKQLDCERGCCQPPVFGGRVPLSDSQWEISWPREVEVLVFTFSRVENARCSMPGAIFEKAWNSGNLGIFRWYVTWLIMIHDCVSLSNQWYMIYAFICGPLRAHVGEIDNATTVH